MSRLIKDLASMIEAVVTVKPPPKGPKCRDCGEHTYHPHLVVCSVCARERYSERDGSS